ncbi:MAG: Sec-independent protein translocase protein TatB [Terricaulis silvestris]
MLSGLGFEEIIILGVLALVVIGPKDLPLLLRKLGQWTAKLRGMAQEFRTGFDELARQAELDDLKREVEALRRAPQTINQLRDEFNRPTDAALPVDNPTPTVIPHDVAHAAATPALDEQPAEAPAVEAEPLEVLEDGARQAVRSTS